MTLDLTEPLHPHPSMVLSAYLERLVDGRRVAVLGDATTGLSEMLLGRGARLVHAYDPEPARVAEALARSAKVRPAGLSFAVLVDDLGVRDGAFDVVVIPDLSVVPDAEGLVRRARKLVGPAGACVVATPNANAKRRLVGAPKHATSLDYYGLFDVVSLQFPHVRMVGQVPFVGYALTEFTSAGEPEVTVDTSLLSTTEEPEWFVAVGSERPVALDPYAVIEVPLACVAAGAEAAVEEEHVAVAELQARLALMSAELEDVREQRRGEAREIAARAAAAEAASARSAELERVLDATSARVRELEATAARELGARGERLAEIEAKAGDAHVRAERLTHDLRDMDEELRRQRDRAVRLSKQLDEEKKARTKAEVELGMIRSKPELTGSKDRLDAAFADLEAARARMAEMERARDEAERERAAAEVARDRERAETIEARATADRLKIEAAEARVVAERAKIEAAESRRMADRARTEIDRARADAAGHEAKAAEHEARAAAHEARAAAPRGPDPSLQRQLTELEQAVREARRDALELTAQRFGANERAKELEQALVEERAFRADLARKVASLEAQRVATPALPEGLLAEHTAEIAALEATLVERGHAIQALKRDLAESDRIGRELVDALEEARVFADGFGEGGGGGGSGDDVIALQGRLDHLATSAARTEADLQAAGWRIAELERRLAETSLLPKQGPGAVQLELEQALVAAHQELAALRRSLGEGERPVVRALAAAQEQSVLLTQLAGSQP